MLRIVDILWIFSLEEWSWEVNFSIKNTAACYDLCMYFYIMSKVILADCLNNE